MSISGFNLDKLMIDSEGVTSIQAKKGRTKHLTIKSKGVSKMDFEDFPAHDADLNCKGTVKIDLTMTGGELTGDIEGVGNVLYNGITSNQAILVKGACQVRPK